MRRAETEGRGGPSEKTGAGCPAPARDEEKQVHTSP